MGTLKRYYSNILFSLITNLIDRVLKIPDLASVACMHILKKDYDILGGPSTGVNFAGALQLLANDSKKYAEIYKKNVEIERIEAENKRKKEKLLHGGILAEYYGARVCLFMWHLILRHIAQKTTKMTQMD